MKIITYPNKILSRKAKPVDLGEIDLIKRIIPVMFLTLTRAHGLGLSAPQIGISERFFVFVDSHGNKIIFINPTITDSYGKITETESCLSLPNIQRKIKRKRVIEVSAINEKGQNVCGEFKNINAIIIQHEIDHLNGITILDSAKKRNLA